VSRLDYGVDGTLKPIVRTGGGRFIESGFPTDFQLKGTTGAAFGSEHVRYDLSVRNYDLIVTRPQTATPYYLFLVCFGPDAERWLVEEPERLTLAASAYWWTDSGVATTNLSSVRVEIPLANRLTSHSIEVMLKVSKDRFEP
jgi:hypothetical protein